MNNPDDDGSIYISSTTDIIHSTISNNTDSTATTPRFIQLSAPNIRSHSVAINMMEPEIEAGANTTLRITATTGDIGTSSAP